MRNVFKADHTAAAIDFDGAGVSMERATKIVSNPATRDLLAAEATAFRAIAAWMRARSAVGLDVDRVEGYAGKARVLTLAAMSERDAQSSVVIGWANTVAKEWADRSLARDGTRATLVQDSLSKLGTMSSAERTKRFVESVPRFASPSVSARQVGVR
jgi:hypothetical protein